MPRAGNIVGGKYRLVEPVGEGSMGSVWMAVHETLGRPFAVKFLKDYQDRNARGEDRFLVEARLSASVRHPFVVAVLDHGRTNEGTPYMVMEFLDGVSLGTRLRQGRVLTVAELIRIVHQALAGLSAVHRAGILHRDLKPDNIMLCRGSPPSGPAVAKLVDFGISRQLNLGQDQDQGQGDRPGQKRLTSPGTTVGTPWYMAPELIQALPSIDLRSDLYSMGVVLYEALTGRVPYMHDDMEAVLMMVSTGEAAPVASLRPDLPPALCALVARAMAHDPADRFASADDFAVALREAARQVPLPCLCRPPADSSAATVPLRSPDELSDGSPDGSRDGSCEAAAFVDPGPTGAIVLSPSLAAIASSNALSTAIALPAVRVPAGRAELPARPAAVRRLARTRVIGRQPAWLAAGILVVAATISLAAAGPFRKPPVAVDRALDRAPAAAAEKPVATSALPSLAGIHEHPPGGTLTMTATASAVPATTTAATPATTSAATGAAPSADEAGKAARPARSGGHRPPTLFRHPGF
jgi:serine/threonine protein kinase